MTDFGDAIKAWTLKVERQSREVFVGSVMAAHASIQVGSQITGAPGQPVDIGNLRASWQADIEGDVGTISTNSEYAPQNEDGIARPGGGPYIQRSAVGGRHSVALTVAGFEKLVAAEVAKVAGA